MASLIHHAVFSGLSPLGRVRTASRHFCITPRIFLNKSKPHIQRQRNISRTSSKALCARARLPMQGADRPTEDEMSEYLPEYANGFKDAPDYQDVGFEHPDWFYAEEIPIPSNKVMSQLLAEILREKIPLEVLFTMDGVDIGSRGFLSLLVAIGRARHWKAASRVLSFFIEHSGEDLALPSSFFLHLAFRRLQEGQYLPAVECLHWLRGTGRPPSAAALELFSKITKYAEVDRKRIEKDHQYTSMYGWFKHSDVGSVFWGAYMGDGTMPLYQSTDEGMAPTYEPNAPETRPPGNRQHPQVLELDGTKHSPEEDILEESWDKAWDEFEAQFDEFDKSP